MKALPAILVLIDPDYYLASTEAGLNPKARQLVNSHLHFFNHLLLCPASVNLEGPASTAVRGCPLLSRRYGKLWPWGAQASIPAHLHDTTSAAQF